MGQSSQRAQCCLYQKWYDEEARQLALLPHPDDCHVRHPQPTAKNQNKLNSHFFPQDRYRYILELKKHSREIKVTGTAKPCQVLADRNC